MSNSNICKSKQAINKNTGSVYLNKFYLVK